MVQAACNGMLVHATQTAMCTGNATIKFSVDPSGVVGTLRSVWYDDGHEKISSFGSASTYPQVDNSIRLRHAGSPLLYSTWLGHNASHLNSNNPYWCNPLAQAQGLLQCGG